MKLQLTQSGQNLLLLPENLDHCLEVKIMKHGRNHFTASVINLGIQVISPFSWHLDEGSLTSEYLAALVVPGYLSKWTFRAACLMWH
jgi:hypothetical protein